MIWELAFVESPHQQQTKKVKNYHRVWQARLKHVVITGVDALKRSNHRSHMMSIESYMINSYIDILSKYNGGGLPLL